MDLASQAANSAAASVEKIYKQELNDCIALLRLHPQARAPCLKYLHSAGWTLDTQPLTLNKSLEAKGKEQSLNTKKAAKASAVAVHGSEGPSQIPSKYNVIGAFSCSLLCERVLPHLDKVSLSPHNLTAALKPLRTAEAKQQEALRILEFVSGAAPTFSVKGAMWQWPVFLEHLKSATDSRGRLDKPLQLPVCWSSAGVYQISKVSDDDELLVEHRFTGVVQKIALSEWDPLPSRDSCFSIEDNFSETSAHVVAAGHPSLQRVPIGGRFTMQTIKKRKAIMDGSVVETTPAKSLRSSSRSSLEAEEEGMTAS